MNRFGAKGSERYRGEMSQADAGLQLNPHKRRRPEEVSVTSCSAARWIFPDSNKKTIKGEMKPIAKLKFAMDNINKLH